jgi:hypothetical protein
MRTFAVVEREIAAQGLVSFPAVGVGLEVDLLVLE